MILTVLTFNSPRDIPSIGAFEELSLKRYGNMLTHDFVQYAPGAWYTAVKPYHSGIFPFMALDLMIMYRGCSSNLFFGHDLLPYSSYGKSEIHMDETMQNQINQIISTSSKTESRLEFKGYGNRIDIGLNALSTLYMDILSSLTKVECGVLNHIRELQFERYKDPTETKTFGLQKVVAERLDKSPVAVHKSLRSAKYTLLAETANAMKSMMV